jgi:TetR/AcrR family transcriptional repressor of mexJK operon
MEAQEEGRSARKRRAILEAATTVFLERGYQGTSMDEIAALAAVSKQTVYKHFADKDRLFHEIIMGTLDQIDEMIHVVADIPVDPERLEEALVKLAREFVTVLMQPQPLRLRRLIIATADRFPELGRTWYEQGFGRVLATLATNFGQLSDKGLLEIDEPMMAAQHFSGLLLWVPLNEAMFCGVSQIDSEARLDHYATAAARAFLGAYRAGLTLSAG